VIWVTTKFADTALSWNREIPAAGQKFGAVTSDPILSSAIRRRSVCEQARSSSGYRLGLNDDNAMATEDAIARAVKFFAGVLRP
jgi:hypothetical protein